MAKDGASDLFLSEGVVPAVRRHGEVVSMDGESPCSREAMETFIKDVLPSGILERLEQEKDLDLSADLGDGGRFRLNMSHQRGALAFSIRRIPSGDLDAKSLRIPEIVMKLAEERLGLVVVTGATGSGKSTTLACMLNHINSTMNKHIVTIEDPIEFTHLNKKSVVSQREIGNDTRDFQTALRHVVRQNPDVVFIGEMRDRETIDTAISAAMTGHLVCATMHTMDAPQTIERIIGYYPDAMRDQIAMDLSQVLRGIVAQRLLPGADGKSRIAAFEILVNTPTLQRLICARDYSGLAEIVKNGVNDGMCSFSQSILKLLNAKLVTLETATAYATNKEEFQLLIEGVKTGVDTLRTYSGDPEIGMSIKKLLRDAVKYGASDLLLTVGVPPAVRIDGVLQNFDMPDLTGADTQKLLYSVLNSHQRAMLEEHKEIDFALTISGLGNIAGDNRSEYRFRVNGYYQKGAIAAAMRIIPSKIPDAKALGLPEAVLKLAKLHQGLVLVTGPTGSGKSTTLAALLDIINTTRACHIITVEDPIEFVHPHKMSVVDQREVGEDTHSFANALKYVLRQDPDVILVGEMRDVETISTALTAAETGHLVLATLHTNDVTQSIDRIIDVFPSERQGQIRTQLAAALEAVIAQRLLPAAPPHTGRIAVFEVLLGNIAIRSMIREKKTYQLYTAMETSLRDGMITMDRALEILYNSGKITKETMEGYTTISPNEGANYLRTMNNVQKKNLV